MCARADTIAVLFVMHAPVHKTNLVRLEACPMPVKDAKRERERESHASGACFGWGANVSSV